MDNKIEFQVLTSHNARKCHPETCCCSTDWVIVRYVIDRCGHIIQRYIYSECSTKKYADERCKELNQNPQ